MSLKYLYGSKKNSWFFFSHFHIVCVKALAFDAQMKGKWGTTRSSILHIKWLDRVKREWGKNKLGTFSVCYRGNWFLSLKYYLDVRVYLSECHTHTHMSTFAHHTCAHTRTHSLTHTHALTCAFTYTLTYTQTLILPPTLPQPVGVIMEKTAETGLRPYRDQSRFWAN